MEFVFFWIIFMILVGIMASKRNRSVIGWLAIAFFLTPLAGILFLLALGENR